MALSAADTAILERWVGTLSAADEVDLEARITRLGNAELAALEKLMMIRADMARNAAQVSSGDDRVSHTANVKWVNDLIGQLVAYIIENDLADDEDLVNQAIGLTLARTTSFDLTARNSRRG